MPQTQFDRAKEALAGISAGVHLGTSMTASGNWVVRVNIAADAPDSVVELVHKKLASIPHEIRRVQPARFE